MTKKVLFKHAAYVDVTKRGIVICNQLDLFDEEVNRKRVERFEFLLKLYYKQFNVSLS